VAPICGARIHGTGSVNLRSETIDYKLNTEAAHFSIGSLHTPINIKGPLKARASARKSGGWRRAGELPPHWPQ
jgi:hypothetical protein